MAPLWHALRTAELPLFKNNSKRFVDGFVSKSKLNVLDGARGFSYSRDDLRTPLLVVMGMVVLVVLMAAVNAASLVLVRSAGRVREFSMRYALGAKRGRVIRQLLIEGMVLGVLGGAAGLLQVPATTHFLVSRMTSGRGAATVLNQHRWPRAGLQFCRGDRRESAVLAGSRTAIVEARPGEPDEGAERGEYRWEADLPACNGGVADRAESLVAGMFGTVCAHAAQSAQRECGVCDRSPDHIWARAESGRIHQGSSSACAQARAGESGGIAWCGEVGATDDAELADNGESGNISVQGYTAGEDEDMNAERPYVTPDYFAALKVPLLAGRVIHGCG